MSDETYMQQAITLAEKGRNTAPPNPWVGCVIVKNNAVIGTGYHHSPGKPHAEIMAFKDAKTKAHSTKDATLYVSLEPCCFEGRTPACTQAIIEAGINRVVIAQTDPDPRVCKKGIQQLKEANIQVDVGICEEIAKKSLLPYCHHRSTGLPYCHLKIASSIDGRIAALDGSSRWITTKAARVDAHHLRAKSQAIAIGSGTALMDNPLLTIRDIEENKLPVKPPLKVVFDSRGRLEVDCLLFENKEAPLLIFTSEDTPSHKIIKWSDAGAEVIVLNKNKKGNLNLKEALKYLGKKNILQILIEGGPTLQGSLFEEQLVNLISVYIGPKCLGPQGWPSFEGINPTTIEEAPQFHLVNHKVLEDNIRLDYTQGVFM